MSYKLLQVAPRKGFWYIKRLQCGYVFIFTIRQKRAKYTVNIYCVLPCTAYMRQTIQLCKNVETSFWRTISVWFVSYLITSNFKHVLLLTYQPWHCHEECFIYMLRSCFTHAKYIYTTCFAAVSWQKCLGCCSFFFLFNRIFFPSALLKTSRDDICNVEAEIFQKKKNKQNQ